MSNMFAKILSKIDIFKILKSPKNIRLSLSPLLNLNFYVVYSSYQMEGSIIRDIMVARRRYGPKFDPIFPPSHKLKGRFD